ncbi:MAG TPA: hypothetical protein VE621_18135 [Bryobacteraceae bacterium]|nr:hypothetical protein [Bryobacteraceae bacterium]
MANGNSTPEHVHEHSDVSVKLLRRFVIGTAVCVGILLLILGFYWRYLVAHDTEPSISLWTGPRTLPSGPLLQPAPEEDLEGYLRRQRELLHTYGWSDPAKQTVHIPIEQAIDRLAQQGLPSRGQPNEKQQQPQSQGRRANASMPR